MLLPVLALAAAQPAAVETMTPVGKWKVSYNNDNCTIERRFAGSGRSATLLMQPALSLDAGTFFLVFDGNVPHRGRLWGHGRMTVRPDGTTYKAEWAGGDLPALGGWGLRMVSDRAVWTALQQAQAIEFDTGTGPAQRLEIGSIRSAWSALAACRADLFRSWGVDPAAGVVEPSSDFIKQFRPEQYPSEALDAHQEGAVGALTTIDRAGAVVGCRIVVSSRSDALDRTTCTILRRVRFPKAAGGPDVRVNFTRIRWTLSAF